MGTPADSSAIRVLGARSSDAIPGYSDDALVRGHGFWIPRDA